MVVKKDKVLFSFEEDIAKRKFKDWLPSHISFLLPIHSYKGDIEMTEDRLTITFAHQNNRLPEIILEKRDLISVYHGFDNVFRPGDDRSRGLTFKPLRITFTKNGHENTLYLIIDFNRLTRTSNNQDWYETLINWMELS